jgi:hypothetical protein
MRHDIFLNATVADCHNRIDYTLCRRQHMTAWKTSHGPTGGNQPVITHEIPGVIDMLATIQLNHQALFNAGKVSDVLAYWQLATELMTIKLPVSEDIP